MCNCSSNFSSFDGFDGYDDGMSGFIRTKAGKKRRKRKKELREQGLSRKEARKQALAEIPRTKKKRQAVKVAKAEARARSQAEAMEIISEEAPEVAELMEEGILSSDPAVASLQVAESVGEEKGIIKAVTSPALSMGSVSMTPAEVNAMATMSSPMGVMSDEVDLAMAKMGADDKIFGLPKNVVYIAGAVGVGLIAMRMFRG